MRSQASAGGGPDRDGRMGDALDGGQDPSWPKEMTFALLSTENASEITRRWGPILAQLEKDLGVKVKPVTATDYRGSIEALKFKKAEIGHLGPKSYIEASNNNYANVEPIAQLQLANGSLGYRSCLIVHAESDLFSPEDMAGKTFAFNDPNSTSGLPGPVGHFHDGDGRRPAEALLQGHVLGLARGVDPGGGQQEGRDRLDEPARTCSSSRAKGRCRAAACG